jgi:hypothetical protein
VKITHEVPHPWRDHLSAIQQQNESDQQRILMLRGQIALLEQQIAENSRAASNIIALLAKEAELPPINYQLCSDSSTISGEAPDPPKE